MESKSAENVSSLEISHSWTFEFLNLLFYNVEETLADKQDATEYV
jgi:hypothetical protein